LASVAERQVAAPSGLVCVAQVATAHGVRGALKLRCFTEDPASVAAYGAVCDAHGRELFRLRIIGQSRTGVIVKAEGIDSREAAEALRGLDLYIPRDRLPDTDTDEFYHSDLVGLAAFDAEGARCGEVVAVQNYGAGDLLEVRLDAGETILVPFTENAVPSIDLDGGRLVIVPPRLS
jgi:16S rRNA processing protein RimM